MLGPNRSRALPTRPHSMAAHAPPAARSSLHSHRRASLHTYAARRLAAPNGGQLAPARFCARAHGRSNVKRAHRHIGRAACASVEDGRSVWELSPSARVVQARVVQACAEGGSSGAPDLGTSGARIRGRRRCSGVSCSRRHQASSRLVHGFGERRERCQDVPHADREGLHRRRRCGSAARAR